MTMPAARADAHDDLAFAGIVRQAALLRERGVSSRELVELYLARIEQLDPTLNAFRTVLAERALSDADNADRQLAAGSEGALLGVPVAVKDGWDVAGEHTTHGTAAYGGVAVRDSEFVRRLREAGAVIVGKTNQPELAIWMFTESERWGATRNPWNRKVIPGGSSGGSGAAVAAGLVGAASASDGAGSTRLPASACGLFGLKPQRGRVPLAPYVDHWHGLTVAGCLTRTVAETALWLDVVSGPSPADPHSIARPTEQFTDAASRPPERLRIAVCEQPACGGPISDEVAAALHSTAALFAKLGHDVSGHELDYGPGVEPAPSEVIANNGVRYLRGIHDDAEAMARPEELMALTKGMSDVGAGFDDAAVAAARAAEPALAARLNSVFATHDVVLTPVASLQPFNVGEDLDRDAGYWLQRELDGFSGGAFCSAWNVTGQPAASIPVGRDARGVPIGLQIVGPPDGEPLLLALAAQVEAELDWASARPPIS